MAQLTELEKARIREACGYPGIGDQYLLAFGIPIKGELIFLLNKRMTNDFEDGFLGLVRRALERAERTVDQIFEAQERLAARKIGNIETNADEITQLWTAWAGWVAQIANNLGVPSYPNRHGLSGAAGGINARVA